MAQMEHNCLDCGHIEFNNNFTCTICVMCGGDRINSNSDETPIIEREEEVETNEE